MDDQHDREPGPVSPFAAPAARRSGACRRHPAGPAETPDRSSAQAPAPPARRFPHVVRFASPDGWVGVSTAVFLVVTDALTRDLYGSVAARDEAFATATSIAFLASAAWCRIITMGLIARLVWYRVRDAFFMLVPLYSYAFAVKMLWRWTALPDRPWDGAGVPASVDTEAPSPRRALRPADPSSRSCACSRWLASCGSPTRSTTRPSPPNRTSGRRFGRGA